MKFSDTTMSVFKNFGGINPSISVKSGNLLKTISPQKSVMAIATLDQDFEGDACIYDLNRFLSTLSLFDEPEIEFDSDRFNIKSGRSSVKYTYAAESMILTPPDREIALPSSEASVQVKWSDFDRVQRASSVLKQPDIVIEGDEAGIHLAAVDISNPSSDTFRITIDDTSQGTFKAVFRSENLRLLPGDYHVEISKQGLSKFVGDVVTYFIAVETTSKF
jgi:hypothetical protein